MPRIVISQDDIAFDDYYKTLKILRQRQQVHYEGGIRRAFGALLDSLAKKQRWDLVEEVPVDSTNSDRRNRVDGALRDQWQLSRAYWEAKDILDDIDSAIREKKARGYPLTNIIFENTHIAVLYQDNREIRRTDVMNRSELAHLLTDYLNYERQLFDSFEEAIESYKVLIPDFAGRLREKIEAAHNDISTFEMQFERFLQVCRTALNPNISRGAVDDMLIQHLLTGEIIRRVFNRDDFVRKNVIAAEIEKVIDVLTIHHLNKESFLQELSSVHRAIEAVAERQADYRAKQNFMNAVYERFFQGYNVKAADTHGVVYTPEEIVDYMCASVEEVLELEFGKKLGDDGVIIIDPATGTGNFVVNLLRRASDSNPSSFEDFYSKRLFANEVMLMPYYIASLNVEYEFFRLRSKTKAFPGLCFVDTLDLTEEWKLPSNMIAEENSARVKRQQSADINVIIGNPPYNVGQVNENDNNKNRTYKVIDKGVKATYTKDSAATYKAKVVDAYVKFFRWAADRLRDRDGIVCYVSNNNFVDAYSYDGFRKHLLQDFHRIYHLDLGGNLRKRREGETVGNVFGITVGVGITVAIRKRDCGNPQLYYFALKNSEDRRRKLKQLQLISERARIGDKIFGAVNPLVNWTKLEPDSNHTWLVSDTSAELRNCLRMGTKEAKRAKHTANPETIFKTYSLGVSTNRDAHVYDFHRKSLDSRMSQFVREYNTQVALFAQLTQELEVDEFVNYDVLKWSRNLKRHLKRGNYANYKLDRIRRCLYRPFSQRLIYFDQILVDELSQQRRIFPNVESEEENMAICVAGVGNRKTFGCLVVNLIPSLDLAFEKTQCFPLYVYDEDGSNRRENITDWALERFRTNYIDQTITKYDIFYYVYGLLHHPDYCNRYAIDLKRQLPRIPLAPQFNAISRLGEELATLHLNYETVERYELTWRKIRDPLFYSVKAIAPQDKRDSQHDNYTIYDTVRFNRNLRALGIPERCFEYRLGNRSILDWIIDQYRVKTYSRWGITHDPNKFSDDEQYILKLIESVITVSLRTVDIVEKLAALPFRPDPTDD